MKPNVIILTNGVSGSSVLSGLIARAGYWLGDRTKKVQYETFENDELVELNVQILRKSHYLWCDVADIPPPSTQKIRELSEAVWSDSFERFTQECNRHRPWLWKDPRLCYTIFFWKSFLALEDCRFIFVSRNLMQTWTGMILRGKTGMPMEELKIISDNCLKAVTRFIEENQLDLYSLSFEKLTMQPEIAVAELNRYLGTELAVSDLEAIYKGTLRRPRWTKMDYLKARLKFFYYQYILKDIIKFPRRKEMAGRN
jgi:hypothetical protein